MNQLLDLVTRWVAVYRLTKLITEDEITQPIRERIDQWADGHPMGSFRERVNYAVNCGACSSVWAGGVVVVLSRSRVGRFAVKALCGSGAALMLNAAMQRLER